MSWLAERRRGSAQWPRAEPADPSTTNYINPVNNLTLLAGPPGFNAGVAISNALKTAGGSVYSQLQWLDKVLKDMSQEITTTVSSLNDTESLNNDAVDKLIKDFQNTIGDLSNPPSGSNSPNPNTPQANPNTPQTNPNTPNAS